MLPAGLSESAVCVLACSGMVSDQLHSVAKDPCRHIARDLHLANLLGKNKMHRSANSLLIGNEATRDLVHLADNRRQWSIGQSRRNNPVRRLCAAEAGV